MNLYLIVYNDGKGLAPYLKKEPQVKTAGFKLDLYLGQLTQIGDFLCVTQEGKKIYMVTLKVLLPDLVAFKVNKDNYSELTSRAFWALKVFCIKCKISYVANLALQKHGPEQQKNWLKALGFMEPIFKGGWV